MKISFIFPVLSKAFTEHRRRNGERSYSWIVDYYLPALKNRPYRAAPSQKYPMENQIYGSYLGIIVTKRYGNL